MPRDGHRATIAPAISGEAYTRVVTIKPAWVLDVSQTDERTPRAAWIRNGQTGAYSDASESARAVYRRTRR